MPVDDCTVTTMRPSAVLAERTRAPAGEPQHAFAYAGLQASIAGENAIADDHQNDRKREESRAKRHDHQTLDAGDQRGSGVVRLQCGIRHFIRLLMTMANHTEALTISAEDDGARLDRVLAAHIPALSRSRLKALILGGQVTIDGRTIRDPASRQIGRIRQ